MAGSERTIGLWSARTARWNVANHRLNAGIRLPLANRLSAVQSSANDATQAMRGLRWQSAWLPEYSATIKTSRK
jgi:hypothetical protein